MTHIMKNMKDIEDFKKKNGENHKDEPKPDYKGAISISTTASLKYMIAPGLLVIVTPIIAGVLFGPKAVEGILAGAIVSGVQVAISASNTGGAWDNAKKETEKRRSQFYDYCKENWADFKANSHRKKDFIKEVMKEWNGLSDKEKEEFRNSSDNEQALIAKMKDLVCAFKEQHTAAVVGDTVGDPLKDPSGPAINILIKLGAISPLVFGSFINDAGYLVGHNKAAEASSS